jgi:hypothetical protein
MTYRTIFVESDPTLGRKRVRETDHPTYAGALRYVTLIVSIARGAGHTLAGSITDPRGRQLATFATEEPDDNS